MIRIGHLTDVVVRRAAFVVSALLVPALFGCSSARDLAGTETATSRAALTSENSNNPAKYTLFEAAPVRPIAVLPDGLVAVTNVPDDRVELFRVQRGDVTHCGDVKVGLRPVALSVVGDRLWVVNHLSDSVSVLDVDTEHCSARIERTLQVGDEPRDIVTAPGAGGQRYVFVTAAHRGQNVQASAGGPEVVTQENGGEHVEKREPVGIALSAEKPATERCGSANGAEPEQHGDDVEAPIHAEAAEHLNRC